MGLAVARHVDLSAAPYGDCTFWRCGQNVTLCVANGLRSSAGAREQAGLALKYVGLHLGEPLAEILAGCDRVLRHTQGMAMGLAVADEEGGTLAYAGARNTCVSIIRRPHAELPEGERIDLRGTLGLVGTGSGRFCCKVAALEPGDTVVLHAGAPDQTDCPHAPRSALWPGCPIATPTALSHWLRRVDGSAILVSVCEAPSGRSAHATGGAQTLCKVRERGPSRMSEAQ